MLESRINKIESLEQFLGQSIIAGVTIFLLYTIAVTSAGEVSFGHAFRIMLKDGNVVGWCLALGAVYGVVAAWLHRGARLDAAGGNGTDAMAEIVRNVSTLGYKNVHQDDRTALFKPSSPMNMVLFLGVPKAGQISVTRTDGSATVEGPMRFLKSLI